MEREATEWDKRPSNNIPVSSKSLEAKLINLLPTLPPLCMIHSYSAINLYRQSQKIFKKSMTGAGETAPWFRALAALTGDLGLVSITAHGGSQLPGTPFPGTLMSYLKLCRRSMLVTHLNTLIHIDNIFMHIK